MKFSGIYFNHDSVLLTWQVCNPPRTQVRTRPHPTNPACIGSMCSPSFLRFLSCWFRNATREPKRRIITSPGKYDSRHDSRCSYFNISDAVGDLLIERYHNSARRHRCERYYGTIASRRGVVKCPPCGVRFTRHFLSKKQRTLAIEIHYLFYVIGIEISKKCPSLKRGSRFQLQLLFRPQKK